MAIDLYQDVLREGPAKRPNIARLRYRYLGRWFAIGEFDLEDQRGDAELRECFRERIAIVEESSSQLRPTSGRGTRLMYPTDRPALQPQLSGNATNAGPAAVIDAFRHREGMAVKELAARARVDQQVIYRIRRGEHKGVSDSARTKVAAVIACPVEDLLPRRPVSSQCKCKSI
jgi:hypothetical protein